MMVHVIGAYQTQTHALIAKHTMTPDILKYMAILIMENVFGCQVMVNVFQRNGQKTKD